MLTVTQHLRNHLLQNLGVFDRVGHMPPLEELRRSQWSLRFEELRLNRMVLGAFRHGLINDRRKEGSPYDNVRSLIARARAYTVTGNTEHLVDIANLAMVEFEIGRHPRKHFRAIDNGYHTPRR